MNDVAPQQPRPSLNGTASVPHILVVDDEQHMCDICARTLRRSGYAATTTSDPAEAVRLLSGEQRFDLLLTDIKMPGMSGLDLAYAAREHDPSIAIIIMTGFASFENIHQSVQRGIADFLSKPFELEQLQASVEQALAKRALLRENLRLRSLEKLLDVSEQLTTTLEPSELASKLLHSALQQSGCRAGFVLGIQDGASEFIAVWPTDAVFLEAGNAVVQRAVDERQSLVIGGQPLCQDGEHVFNAAFAAALQAHGEVNGVLVLCDEATQMPLPSVQEEIVLLTNYAGAALRNALLHQQLSAAYQRLQDLDRLKSEFIAIASHELRTPLSIVLGYGLMIRDRSAGDEHEYAKRVMEGGQRIKEIVDDMVSLRYLDTGETQVALQPCAADELIAGAVERMQFAIAERQLQLDTELPQQPLIFKSDHEKVTLILSHLLSNAVKFTPRGGQISMRASVQSSVPPVGVYVVTPIQPHTLSATKWVVLEVQDTGIGISEQEQSRIFERFYQVASSLTRDHGGTGLGLAVVRELALVLGGVVWLTSQAQHGSTFTLALPYLPG